MPVSERPRKRVRVRDGWSIPLPGQRRGDKVPVPGVLRFLKHWRTYAKRYGSGYDEAQLIALRAPGERERAVIFKREGKDVKAVRL